jgi:two-component system chemotaxis sensor kinase CheA
MNSLDGVNRDLLNDFLDESGEALGGIEPKFVKLSGGQVDPNLVDSIFRPIHSIKGNAAYFGLMKVKDIAHRMESALDLVRQGRRQPDPALAEALLRGLDSLRLLFGRARELAPEEQIPDEFAELLGHLDSFTEAPEDSGPMELPAKAYNAAVQFVDRLPPSLQQEGRSFLSRFRSSAPWSGGKEVENLSDLLRSEDPRRLPPEKEKAILARMEEIAKAAPAGGVKSALEEVRDIARTFLGCAVGLDLVARELILEKLKAVPADVPALRMGPATENPSSQAVFGGGEEGAHRERTMRIPESGMDKFLEQVGELMGLEEQFRYLGKRMLTGSATDELSGDLRQAVEQFGHLSSKLSSSVLELRRTEARPLLQKVSRLVMDVAGKLGKKIETVTTGESIRIDKSYLELLDAPLMHMVRNACDHGIESPSDRRNARKPETGKVLVEIAELEESVVLSISDDGKGLDMEALRRKAVALGLHRAEAAFTEDDAIQVLFQSGVSTAREVTEISGRGVGMDVVRREVEGAGGRIEVRSRPGEGSVFRVVLPRAVTTRITDGFLFRSGEGRFVVPMRTVVETFTVEAAVRTRLPEAGEALRFRDRIFRLVLPAELLDTPMDPEIPGVYVRLRARDQEFVLLVQEVLGVQRTVVKPIDRICQAEGLFAGAALVGDGGMALVIGEDGLSDWLKRRSPV